jgi:hypothetical protein
LNASRNKFDLGKIQLNEIEWAKQKFEENLEEWQVTCSHGAVEIGRAESSLKYTEVAKNAATSDSQKPAPALIGRRRPLRP